MRSQLQFFMFPEDETEFLDYATREVRLRLGGDGRITYSLEAHGGEIQFARSARFDLTLTEGGIALATTSHEGEYYISQQAAKKIEADYNRLRRWLKARYTNKLVSYAEYIPLTERAPSPTRQHWLGPHAREWLRSNPDATLRQAKGYRVVFKLEEQA